MIFNNIEKIIRRSYIYKIDSKTEMDTSEAKLYSIAIFSEGITPAESNHRNDNSDNHAPMSLEEYEQYVDEDGRFNNVEFENSMELLGHVVDTVDLSFFNKKIFREFMLAGIRHIAEYHKPNSSVNTYEFDAPNGEVYTTFVTTRNVVDSDRNCHRILVVVVTSSTYPKRLKLTLSDQLIRSCTDYIGSQNAFPDSVMIDRELKECLERYADITNVDNVASMRAKMNDTKEVMKDNIEKILARGDQIDELVEKSADLSNMSRSFYIQSKKLNRRCCIIL